MNGWRKKILRLLVLLAWSGTTCSSGWGASAVGKVREGLQEFAQGEFSAAQAAFAAADVADPENEIIAFNRACALAATGDVEQARELFLQAALARDPQLAAQAHYNLGSLAAAQGRATLGDDPLAATAEHRQQATDSLLTAAGHYRDCLKLVAEHADARHNLELIRLFLKHIQAQWQQHDREKNRQEMGLVEFLEMIQQRQQALRSTVRGWEAAADSPPRRPAASATADQQRQLQEEIAPLQAKIAEQFQPAPSQQASPANPVNDSQRLQAEALLTQLAAAAGAQMLEAATAITAGQFSVAQQRQRDVLDQLQQIFMAVAPFAKVLQRATQQQQQLMAISESATAPATATENPADAAAGNSRDPAELQWRQAQVADESRMLSLKAQSELPALEAQLAASPAPADADPSAVPPDPKVADPPQPTPQPDTTQLAALQKSYQLALQLGPQVEQQASAAATKLGASEFQRALPDQQQALELLREIAEPVAQENQTPDKQAADQGGAQDQNQNQNQNQDQQAKPDQQQNQNGPAPQTPPASPPEQQPDQAAQAVLRRARQRAREHRDLQKQMRGQSGVRVPRDW